MRKTILFAGLLAIVLPAVIRADVLVVTKKGESIWATTANKEGDTVTYTRRDDGVDVKSPASELDGVLPVVKRGTSYEKEEIEKYVERIKKTRSKHPTLLKQINGILQEWENLLKPDTETEGKITALAGEFAGGQKDTRAYRRLTVEMGMLQYKDMQGKYAGRMKTILADAKKEYVSTNQVRIQALVASGKTDVDTFLKIKTLATDLLQVADAPLKESIQQALNKSAAACLEAGLRDGPKVFAGAKTMAGYLESSRRLYVLKNEVAATEDTQARVDKAIGQLNAQVSAAIKTHDFSHDGFPLTQEDVRQFNAAGERASRTTFADTKSENACLVVPTRSPGRLRLGQPFEVPVKLIFNQAQPADRVFGMIVQMHQKGGGLNQYTIRLEPSAIANAQATATVRDDFAKVDKSFTLGPSDKMGNSYYFCCLAYRASEDNGNGQEDWRALSSFCSWLISP